MSYPGILFSTRDHVATLALNRPERLNAFSPEMLDSALRALAVADEDPDVRVIVLTGSGRGFCAGADIKRMAAERAGGEGARVRPLAEVHQLAQAVLLALHRTLKPVVGAINGVAAGAGFELSLACDIRIAAESAYFKEAAMGVGLVAGDGSAWFLPRLIGLAGAFEVLYLEESITATRAAELGFVNWVVPDHQFTGEVARLAARLARKPPIAMSLTKQSIIEGLTQDLPASLDSLRDMVAQTLLTSDHAEAARAIKEGRLPRFTRQ